MKTKIRSLTLIAALATSAALPLGAFGQVVSESTTTTSNGTVSDFSPDSIVVHSESAAEPIHYSYSKQTTVVDEAGNPVDVSIVKTGVPVQVYYEGTGEHMVARKIVVHKVQTTSDAAPVVVEKKSTTTTTTTESH